MEDTVSDLGRAAGIKPEAFKIIDGKLYLSWGKGNKFFKNPEKHIQKADRKWSRALMKLNTQNWLP
jgi:hypothetical protein